MQFDITSGTGTMVMGLAAADFPCIMQTVLYTFSAKVTAFKIIPADISAFSAAGAFILKIHHLRHRLLTFRIVAPSAAQITAFKEDGSPYTRPVNK